MTTPDRILIRLPNWLGDLMLARPLLHGLRRTLPRAEILGVAPAALLELIEPDATLDRGEPWPGTRSARAALIGRLRAWRPDVALVLPPSFSSAWFAHQVGAVRRTGYAHEGRGLLLTERPRRAARGEVHLSDEYLALGRELGVRGAEAPDLPVPERGRRAAEALLAEVPAAERGFAILGPGAAFGPAKRWPAPRFAELGRRAQRRGRAILVCGAPDEAPLCAELAEAIGGNARAVAGRTDLATQAALCARAALAVCNDSGLSHLAAAAGTPTVVVFGSTSSAWTAPRGSRVRVVQRAPVCSPCFRRTCVIGYRCLESIAVGEVDRACREIAA